MYEAQSVTTGNWIKGTLEWDGLAMFIVEDHGFGKTKVQCIPGTERELNEDESQETKTR